MTSPPDKRAPRYLTAEQLHRTLTLTDAIAALERGFAEREAGQIEGIPRSVVPVPAVAPAQAVAAVPAQAVAGAPAQAVAGVPAQADEMLVMPAVGPEGAGAKIVTLARGNPARGLPMVQGVYALFSADELTPELLIDAAALTGLRTAAVSALATRHLARPDSRRLVVFGAGPQARAHAQAMRALPAIEDVTVVGASPGSARAQTLVEDLREDGVRARVGTPEDVRGADLICTATTSTAALFSDELVAPGTHINAVGAYRPGMCELPSALLARALLVVETRESALAEAGDILAAIAAGALAPEGFAHELRALVRGEVRRESAEQVTVFKSVGLAIEDLILARAAADRLSADRP